MAYINGTNFSGNKKDENKLKDVIISSHNDDTLLHERMYVAYNSKLSLENVTITQAEDDIFAKSNSQVTVSGRLVSTKTTGVYTESGSVITVKDKAEIISLPSL
ncbi:autotransporter [Bartonella henselae]|uniref:Autotransporter n=2 Tax=Bartonella henselae TaxID=38323 RepID=X5MGE6_BARHN|nr:autotransporter [Bartonella henselae]